MINNGAVVSIFPASIKFTMKTIKGFAMKRTNDTACLKSTVITINICKFQSHICKEAWILKWLLLICVCGIILLSNYHVLKNVHKTYGLLSSSACVQLGATVTYDLVLVFYFNPTLHYEELWSDLFRIFTEFDENMMVPTDEVSVNGAVFWLGCLMGVLVCILLLFFTMVTTVVEDFELWIFWVYLVLSIIVPYANTIQFYGLINILDKRYYFARLKIQEIYHELQNMDNVWNADKFIEQFYVLIEAVKKINQLFGKRILIMLIADFFNKLNALHFYLLERIQLSFIYTICILSLSFLRLVSIIK